MQKKNIITVLSVVLAMIVASIALVFTFGPQVSALNREALVVTLDESDFKIVDHVVYGLKEGTAAYINGLFYSSDKGIAIRNVNTRNALEVACGGYYDGGNNYNRIELRVQIPEGVTAIQCGDGGSSSFLQLWYYGDEYDYNGDGYPDLNGYNWGNYNLESIKITVSLPSTLEIIGDYAFYGCRGLTEIEIPEGVTEIGYAAFSCAGLTNVTIPNTVTSIGRGAFRECGLLESVDIPASVEYFGDSVFADCDNLTDVVLARGITAEISDCMFCNCESLTSVEIPATVENIGGSAFVNCRNLTNVVLHEGLLNIGDYAFENCYGLKTVTIPASVTYVGTNVFDCCDDLTEINVLNSTLLTDPNLLPYLNTVDEFSSREYFNIDENGVLSGLTDAGWDFYDTHAKLVVTVPNGVTSISYGVFDSCNKIISVNLPAGLTTIGNSAFNCCSNLESINIPNTVTEIGNSAFNNCIKLISITIPEGVKVVDYYTFFGCKKLTSVVIPSTVTTIHTQAFAYCDQLESVTIPDGVTTFDWGIFDGCNNLTTINASQSILENNYIKSYVQCVIDGARYFDIDENGVLTGLSDDGYNYVSGYNHIRIIVPDGVTEIRGNIENWCSALNANEIVLPDSLEIIGDCAFYNNAVLRSITIPDHVTSIGHYAFANCTNLEQVTIGSGVTSIGRHAFENCSKLTTVIIPANVKTIDAYAFSKCSNLMNIEIAEGVQEIGAYAFQECYNVETITIPASVTTIGEWFFGAASVGNNYYLYSIVLENPALINNTPNLNPYQSIIRGVNFNVTFDANGGTNVAKVVVVKNATVDEPETTRTGYTFQGWYLDNILYNFSTPVTADVTLVAKWQINTYDIAFISNSNDTYATQTINHGDLATKPTDPTKENYNFLGWYTDAEYSYAFDFTAPVTKDNTLYAKWEINKYVVLFNPFNGDDLIVQEINAGGKATIPDAPIRENYLFQGWYVTDTDVFNVNTTINQNVSVIAKWKPVAIEPQTVTPQPTEPETEVKSNNVAVAAGIAGGSAVGVGSLASILSVVFARKRRR